MRSKIVMLCCLAACLQAQPDPGDLLQRVTRKVLETVGRLPRYMCTQTIDRSQYEPASGTAGHSCDSAAAVEALREVPPGARCTHGWGKAASKTAACSS